MVDVAGWGGSTLFARGGRWSFLRHPGLAQVPIPTKPPVYNGMIAPRDSWMTPPLYNEMIPPGGAARVGLKISSPCDGPWSSRFGLFAPRSAQALSSEFDAMGVVNEAVEDGVGVSGSPNIAGRHHF